ncbi:54S ribosomal protein img2, mitochondrial [Sporothrix stenoceras]|uniref:Large ribosomal subunit protein mL49 n=1 Tax=Sporothrix stenoceras TaxID=5173 RepID=A0ABR3YWL9_9PEZI
MSTSLAASSRAFVRCAHFRPATAQPMLQRMFLSTTPAASATATATTTTTTSSSTSIADRTPLPYRIGRSNSLNYPVYHRIKSGGTNRTTELKKVEGDAKALAQHLATDLKLETKVNPRTNFVIVKGFHRETLVKWLTEKGM